MKMYEVWELKMPLNTNFDGKIVLWEPLTIVLSIKKTLYIIIFSLIMPDPFSQDEKSSTFPPEVSTTSMEHQNNKNYSEWTKEEKEAFANRKEIEYKIRRDRVREYCDGQSSNFSRKVYTLVHDNVDNVRQIIFLVST